MTAQRPIAVLRPEPGNAATAARIAAAGRRAIRLPLFAVQPIAWTPVTAANHDALFLTSANAVRHAGAAIANYRDLPVYAVGAETATAARSAGLTVVAIGTAGATALAVQAAQAGVARALHLAGRDRATDSLAGVRLVVEVYVSEPLARSADDLVPLAGSVALVHSPRASARLAALVNDRADIAIAAISSAAREAAGTGWAQTAVAGAPNDQALVEAALAIAD